MSSVYQSTAWVKLNGCSVDGLRDKAADSVQTVRLFHIVKFLVCSIESDDIWTQALRRKESAVHRQF